MLTNPQRLNTTVGGYTVSLVAPGTWALLLTSTGERLRTYPSRERAVSDAERYERLTANLSA